MFMILCMYHNLCFVVEISFLYSVVIVPFILLEFRVDRKKSSYFACHKLRTPPLLWSAWRTVQVLQGRINDFIGIVLIPVQMICSKMVVICVFLVIQHSNELSPSRKLLWIIWAVLTGIFWSMVLLLGGYIYLYGKKVLISWKYHKWEGISRLEKRIMSRFRKSCIPISVAYGSTYVIKRLTVLKFVRGLVTSLFRVLLTIGVKR